MIAVVRRARWAAPAAAVLLMTACAASKPRIEPPPPAPPPLDASYDWHVLLVAPFGSVLKEVPLALHEVLVFRDSTAGAAAGDEPECYAVNGSAPRFITREPSEYLLCFKHDRLSRIEATVRLPAADADRILSDACGLWMKNAQAPKAEAPKAEESSITACEGVDGNVAFSANVEKGPDETTLTVQLDATDLASDAAADRAHP